MNNLNYLDIVLTGHLNSNTQNYLTDYFLRECKAAKEKGFSEDEFLDGCTGAVEVLEAEISRQLHADKKPLNSALIDAVQGGEKEAAEEIRAEIKLLDKSDYMINLGIFTGGRYGGELSDADTRQIREHLTETRTQLGAEPPRPMLTLQQIALIHIYEGWMIDKDNSDDIAKKYGHNSGEKLLRHFNKHLTPYQRTGEPAGIDAVRSLKAKIKVFESVQPLLSETAKSRALDELQILRSHLID